MPEQVPGAEGAAPTTSRDAAQAGYPEVMGLPDAEAFHRAADPNLAERLREAQQSLLERPHLSIRLRLIVSLSLCFLLCAAFAVGSLVILRGLRARHHLLQTIERLDDRILRERAHADESILSSDDLERVLERAKDAEDVLRREASAADAEVLPALLRHVEACRRLLAALPGEGQGHIVYVGTLPPEQALELRVSGAATARLLLAMIRRERVSIEGIHRLAELGPLVLLGFLLLLFAVIALSFNRALYAPIGRFKGYTSRIASGDFSFIRPARRYRDEFSDLTMAVNEMLAELRKQQDRMIKGAKLTAVGTLASGIAHELNNPLNNVAITTEALMENLSTLADDEKWRLLQDIYFETERASEVVKSLLDFTRHEKPEMVPLDLAEVVQSTLRLAQNEMAINDVTFVCDLPKDMPRVRASPNQLRQVFLNLFINAIQAMPDGGRLSVVAKAGEPGKVCVEIADQGVGIPPEVLPRVFDPFFTTKEPGKGTGLGLTVSLGIIRKFGGDIQVGSEPGKGTTVHVCLPQAGEGASGGSGL